MCVCVCVGLACVFRQYVVKLKYRNPIECVFFFVAIMSMDLAELRVWLFLSADIRFAYANVMYTSKLAYCLEARHHIIVYGNVI